VATHAAASTALATVMARMRTGVRVGSWDTLGSSRDSDGTAPGGIDPVPIRAVERQARTIVAPRGGARPVLARASSQW
jgi:hypothetical protein